jgi:hypothetical protein
MRPHRARRSAFAALVAVALLFPLASCDTSPTQSQSSAPTTSAPTTSAAPTTTADTTTACADVAALKSSLENLTKVKPAEDGVTALTTRSPASRPASTKRRPRPRPCSSPACSR